MPYVLKCSAPGCGNLSREKRLSFFVFPKEPGRCSKWLRFCGLEDRYHKAADILSNMRLCSDHFQEKDYYTIRAGSKRKLNNTAIPTVHSDGKVVPQEILKCSSRSPTLAPMLASPGDIRKFNHQVLRTYARRAKMQQAGSAADVQAKVALRSTSCVPLCCSTPLSSPIVTFGKMHLLDMNMSTETMNQSHTGFNALGCSKYIVDGTDEQQQIEYKYGYVISGVEEESFTGYIKKEPDSCSCSPERDTSVIMKQEMHIKQEENEGEKVQNNYMTTNIKDDPDLIESINTDFDLKQEIKKEYDFKQGITEKLDQILEKEIAQNEDGMLEECWINVAPSYATDPLLLNYKDTFYKQENGLNSTFFNNVEECTIEVNPALDEPDPLLEGSGTHCTQAVNPSNFQENVSTIFSKESVEECSSEVNPALYYEPDPLLVGSGIDCIQTVTSSNLQENFSTIFLQENVEGCSSEVNTTLYYEPDPLPVGSGTNCTQAVTSNNLQDSMNEKCSKNINSELHKAESLKYLCVATSKKSKKEHRPASSSDRQIFVRKTYSRKKSTLNKACLLGDGQTASSTDSDNSQPQNSIDVQVEKPAFILIRLKGSMEKNSKQIFQLSRTKCPTLPDKLVHSVKKVIKRPLTSTLNILEGTVEKNPKQIYQPSRYKCPTLPAKLLHSVKKIEKPACTLIRLEGSMEKNPKQTCQPSRSKCLTIPAKPLVLVNKDQINASPVWKSGLETTMKKYKNCRLLGLNLKPGYESVPQLDKPPCSKSSEDKKAVSSYVSRNGKMSLYEFRKTLASLIENRPIKYIRGRCYFPGCSSNDINSRIFYFPRNLERTQDWLQRIGHSASLEDANNFAHRKFLCCKHFSDEQFQSSKLRNKLKSISVPYFWSPIYSKDVASLHSES